MSREVCGICWCPYDDDTGECACEPEPKKQHMTDLRTAAQQALEALDAYSWEQVDEARTTLRAALAEPVQEPVAWLSRDDARLALWEAINKREFGNPTDDKLILDHLHQQGLWIGKYTAPPQRKPLNEEEILSVLRLAPPEPSLWPHLKDEAVVGDVQKAVLAIARAVERAHGIGDSNG